MNSKRIEEGLTFDDILLVPQKSNVIPKNVNLSTRLTRKIRLNIPVVSSPMDTVTESQMAIAIARQGGIGIIHRNLSIEKQVEEVSRVKRSESGVITKPFTLGPKATIKDARNLMDEHHISGIPVIDDSNTLIGIVTNRDIRFTEKEDVKISQCMTSRESMIVAAEKTSLEKAQKILHKHRIEKLPLTDKNFKLKGLITVKDIQKKKEFPSASNDKERRLLVGAAIGVGEDMKERLEVLCRAEVDVIVIDTSHGHSENVIRATKQIRKEYPDLEIIAGNVATAQATLDLIKAGASGIRVGIGPGSICTTRIISGIGVPQITAILDCIKAASKHNIPIIADGGIRYSGDVTKALVCGASTVMLGNLLAGTDESPGEIIWDRGERFKSYRGMGSVGAMRDGSERYPQEYKGVTAKLVPEGVEAKTPYKGTLAESIWQILGGVKSGMGYLGAKNIKELQKKARLVRISQAGLYKSHPHSITIVENPPNYN